MPPQPDTFTVGLVQMRCTPDPAANLHRAEAGVRDAARKGAQIICLPELFLRPYFCQRMQPELFSLAESIPGPTTNRLAEIARQTGTVVVAPVFERRTAGVYHNSAAVLDADGELLGVYRKMHIPDDPLYHEKYYFTPGDLGFRAFDTRFGRVGVLICWDQWFPEGARLTALRGADVLFYPTAIGWHPAEKEQYGVAQHQAWELIQRSHAVANGVYVAAVNRTGYEQEGAGAGLEFWGASFVSDPFGVVLERAGHKDEGVVVVECQRSRMEDVRRNWPFLRDRRIDAYGDLTRRLLD
jgi:N-carbamoylputrescine amidase